MPIIVEEEGAKERGEGTRRRKKTATRYLRVFQAEKN